MTALKVGIQSILKGLEMLTREAERMEKVIDGLEDALTPAKGKPVRKVPARKPTAKKKPVKTTATDQVLTMIKLSRKGTTTPQIRRKMGFSDKKIWGIVNSLKKQGKVKSEKKGLYVRA